MDHPIQISSQVGVHLSSSRQAQKLSQEDVGAKIGLSQKRVSALERNPECITVEQLIALTHAVGLEVVIRLRKPASEREATEW